MKRKCWIIVGPDDQHRRRHDYAKATQSVTYYSNEPTWALDKEALDEVVRQVLRLQWPVFVRRTKNKKSLGRHTLYATRRSKTPVHNITVNKFLCSEQASQILWHELCHAMQSERELAKIGTETARLTAMELVRRWGRAKTRCRSMPYHERPVELEAKSYEEAGVRWPLAKEA